MPPSNLIALYFIFGAFPAVGASTAPVRWRQVSPADQAVERLWSAEKEERESGKLELVRLGSDSIDPLLRLLSCIKADPGPRYPKGKEKEAAEALKRYRDSSTAGRLKMTHEEVSKLLDDNITWRLKSDVCEILGVLRAESAAPLLVQVMADEQTEGPWETMLPEMKALAAIGPGAVPTLMEAITRAAEVALATSAGSSFGLTSDARRSVVARKTYEIKARAAMVLGGIGDRRAIPVLEEELKLSQDRFLRPYLQEALDKIRKK